jgi:hypothetical protein
MVTGAFILSAEPGKRALCKRTQLRYTGDGSIEAIDLDKAKIDVKPFPKWFTARGTANWSSAHELRADLLTASGRGEALIMGDILDAALTGLPVVREAIYSENSSTLPTILPVDLDGIEINASCDDLNNPSRVWAEVLPLLRLPSNAAGVLQITGSQPPLPGSAIKTRLRLRAYFLLAQPITLAAAKVWAASLPKEIQVDGSAFDKGRIHFLVPPRLYTSTGEPVPEFLPQRFFAYGTHKVVLSNAPAPLMSDLFNTRHSNVNLPLGGEIDAALAVGIDHAVEASLRDHPINPDAGGWHGAIRSADWAVVSRLLILNIRIDSATIAHAAQRMLALLTSAVESGKMLGRSAEELKAELCLAERQRSLIGAWRRQTTKAIEAPPIPEIEEKDWPTTAAMKGSLPKARAELREQLKAATANETPPSPTAVDVVSPPGTGKTHACAEVAIERAMEGNVVEIYGPQHRLLRELNRLLHGLPNAPRVAHHVGRNHVFPDKSRACVRWPVIERAVECLGAHEVRTSFCENKKAGLECQHLHTCKYIGNENLMRMASIRLMTHAILVSDFTGGESEFNAHNNGTEATPRRRIVIIDETPKVFETSAYLLPSEVAVSPAFLQWLHTSGKSDSIDLGEFYAVHGGYLTSINMIKDAENKLAPSIKVHPGMSDAQVHHSLTRAQADIKPGIPGRGSDTRVRQWNLVKLLRRLALTYPQGGRLSSIWTTADGILHLAMAVNIYGTARLHPSYFAPKVAFIDATPDKALLAATGLQVREVVIDVVDGLFTVQVVNADWYASKISPSKAAEFAKPGDSRVESFAGGRLLRLLWLRWALGACMMRGTPLTVLPKAVRRDAGLLDNPSTLHYGALRGLDEFGTRAAVVLLGGPLPRITTMVEAARIRFPGSPVTGTMQLTAAEQITDAAGNNYTLPIVSANNPAVDHCLQQVVRDELRQAAYRLRASNRALKPVAIAVNNIPLRSQVDLVVDYAELVPPTAECRSMTAMTVLDEPIAPLSGKWLRKALQDRRVLGGEVNGREADLMALLGDISVNDLGREMRTIDIKLINACLIKVWRLLPPDVRKEQPPKLAVVRKALSGSQGRTGREISCLVLDDCDGELFLFKNRGIVHVNKALIT